MNLFTFIDCHYGSDADVKLEHMLEETQDINETFGPASETGLHVATRRYRLPAVQILLQHGADIDAKNLHGKTAFAHAIRRGFYDVSDYLKQEGANTSLNEADQFACAITAGNLEEAKCLLEASPDIIRTGNPEEDRLLADMAGRNELAPVKFLVEAGADLEARGLDDGTPLHQAAWFGQPDNAQCLVEAGAPLEIFDTTHASSPLGWAVHGSRYSGAADERQAPYIKSITLLLKAGANLHYPNERADSLAYYNRLMEDASDAIKAILSQAKSRHL